ncbi:hypothetical protein N7462_001943 [Penicillium macrosclerotiorum]|uniref:uncharacterized protein n=1 Tax=Penicillium macrosclerotiorum TaxID=303699 RepID=UPI002548C58A|nr:uncharacterized protein N7462_001943 [Penicillium macrosclerotiorum]KAJ5692520.1 hypothetical protein N7462_001943 [Penicillium macrosclerotiorum]
MRLSLSTGHDAKDLAPHTPTSMSSLTPPVTPIAKDANDPERSIPSPLEDTVSETSASLLNYRAIDTPLRFTDDLEICHGQDGRPVEFGRGAWSIVYKAQSAASPAGPIYTPPSSPIIPSRVFAVKAPLRRDAHQILQAEALTLTRLNLTPGFENHVVPFYGLHSDSKALVMSPIPLALSTYIEDQADLMRRGQSTTLTMFDPVQGVDSWRDMARKLISSLAWLHNTAGIIHGDIKPHNILLRCIPAEESSTEASAFPYEPLLADFSSAFDIPSDSMAKPDPSRTSMSAFTPPFTAPELLSLASLKSGDVAPTSASDVFSLAATLTAAATGDLLLYPGSSSMQRLAMARDGHQILEFTRAGLNGCRVPRKGGVEKLILPAVAKDPTRRISTQDWLVLAST